MYKIIGGDGQEYGPVTDLDIHKWIAEGRLNAQSLAKAESDAEFRPLSTFPEFASAFGGTASAHIPIATEVDWSKRDYELDIGGCISRGWSLFADNVGLMLGSTVLYLVIIIAVTFIITMPLGKLFPALVSSDTYISAPFQFGSSVLVQILLALVYGPLTGGFYYMLIRAVRGETLGIGDLFLGFQRSYLQLFLGYFVVNFIMGLCMLPFNILIWSRVLPLTVQMQHGATPAQMQALGPEVMSTMMGTLPIFFVCLIPVFCLMTIFQFTVPLIMDQQMNFGTAMKTCLKMVIKHWFAVFGLLLFTFLILFAGGLCCCVGLLVAFPLACAAQMVAYETIFCESRDV
jgi:GYF domain 2